MKARWIPGLLLTAVAALAPAFLACAGPGATVATASEDDGMIAVAAGPIELSELPSRVRLAPSGDRPLAAELEALGPDRRLYLVLRGLSASAPPGVLFHLYLGLPAGAEPATDDPRHVGSLNFFGATPVDGGTRPPGPAADWQSFEVSRAVRSLGERGLIGEAIELTIRATGSPTEGARPVIGRVELVVQ